MSAGSTFKHVEAIGGASSTPNRRHRYRYLLTGRGKAARFQLRDEFPSDNYGVVTIKLRKATKSEIALGQAPPTPGQTPPPSAPTPAP
jgi:hypothetical protein